MVRHFGVTFSWGMSVVGMSVVLAMLGGCGKSPSSPQADANARSSHATNASAGGEPVDVAAAMETVAHFLDAVRRGGDTGGAHSLLTRQAAAVLERLGRTVQPIGSPDATFTVTRSEAVPDHADMALVHSTWSEPTAEGQTESYQVVWALQLENRQWRISGLAMELDAQQPPLIVDFEDHVEMANLFRGQAEPAPESSVSSASSTADDSVSQSPPAAGRF